MDANVKAKAEPKTVVAEPVVTPAADPAKPKINDILDALPATFTPADLDKLFSLNDGGKTIRRHLRKHFAEVMTHEHKASWSFTKKTDNAKTVVEYFASKYSSVNLKALAKTK